MCINERQFRNYPELLFCYINLLPLLIKTSATEEREHYFFTVITFSLLFLLLCHSFYL